MDRRIRGGLAAAVFVTAAASAEEPPHLAALPPELPWAGRSRELALPPDDPWATPCERSGLEDSPTYGETVAWLERLVEASPQLHLTTLGSSPEGREIWMVVASAEGAATPEALRARGKPTLLAQAGIHAGEIDGKDAGMMLLRDLTVRRAKTELLAGANLLFIPIFNVDGHERRSRYGRINQRGPLHTGWRTTSRNLNLNRDYAKLDTPEMRHLIRALDRWRPDLYVDLHVTDGADYQHDITFGFNGSHAWSPAIGRWLEEVLTPAVSRDLRTAGHLPGPLIFPVDRYDLRRGTLDFTAGPRYSNGYGDARHLPTVLVENHSLKPFAQRVLGTYVFLESALTLLAERSAELRDAVAADRERRPSEVALAWQPADDEPPRIELLGIEQRLEPSAVSGGVRIEWTGQPVTLEVPLIRRSRPAATVARPTAYWIPPAWAEVIDRLELHGIEVERSHSGRELDVEMLRLASWQLAPQPFEGRARVTAEVVAERRRESFPAGSVRVRTDQPLGDLAILLLEPAAPDSFFQWGFFLEVLSRTEYVEGYVMEAMAERMLAEDPELRAELTSKLAADREFRSDPAARLRWLYRRTPYFDDRWGLYPVAREP